MLRLRLLALLPLYSALACAHTSPAFPKLDPRVLELAAQNERPITVSIDTSAAKQVIGSQYVFVLLPLGQVQSGAVESFIRDKIFESLALCGYKPLMQYSLSERPEAPHLDLTLNELSASAHDLLFIRRVSCSANFRAQMNGHVADGGADDASYKRYGFAPELGACLTSVIEEGLHDVLSNLRFCRVAS